MNTSILRRITCLLAGFLAIIGGSCPKVTPATDSFRAKVKPSITKSWYEHSMVGIEVGPTGAQFGHSDKKDTRYCEKFDGRDIVRYCLAANSDYLVIWARDGDYAYYDSKILPKAPGLGKRDVLQETMEEAQKHNLPVIAYCVVQQGGHFLDEHPEYEMHDYQGNRIGRFCYNSGYLEVMKEIVAEQLSYGIAGFHIDMLDQGFGPPYGCWCEHCQEKFKAEYGHMMPKCVTWDDDWDHMLEFRYATSEKFEKALYEHIKKLNPKVTVDYNYHGNPPFSWEVGQRPVQHAGNSDFVTGETGVWGFSALTVGLNAEFYRAATPDLPFQIAMQRGVRMYHDQTTRPLNDIRWELLTLLSHGAFVTIVDKTGFDGWLDPVAYERMGKAFKEVQNKQYHFGHKQISEVGIYFSSRTRDWIGRDHPETYFQNFQGAHKALVYEHIPWSVVLDENATIEILKLSPIILLPNAGIMSNDEVELLQHYVKDGGNLIITGQTACYDRMGKLLKRSLLDKLIGAKFVRRLDSLDNWVRFDSSSEGTDKELQLRDGIPANWPFLVKGPAVVFELESAKTFGKLLRPYRTTRQREGKEGTDWPMSADSAVGPAVLVNSFGKGKVVAFACSPDFATASEHHIVEARRLLRNAVRLLNPKPRVSISAPVNVEAVVTEEQSERVFRIHLLAYNSSPQTTPSKNRPYILPGLIENIPMYRVSIEFTNPIKNVSAFSKSTNLQQSGQRIVATINNIHEIIIIRY
jgi:hypothetical protein